MRPRHLPLLLPLLFLPHLAAHAACPLPASPITNEQQARLRAGKIVEAHQLSKLKRECLQFFVEKPAVGKGFYTVDVREIHNAQCGGDPQTSPRVLSLEIAADGQYRSDAGANQMETPRCPAALRQK